MPNINHRNNSLYFYILKISPQGGQRYDQALRFLNVFHFNQIG